MLSLQPRVDYSFSMREILIVGLGGFLGSVARLKLSGWILHSTLDWRFPLPTFCVNVLGCLLIGILAGLAEERFSFEMRLFLLTGILGGFTTFSAFGLEGVDLVRRGDVAIAIAYALLSIVCGFTAVWFGLRLIAAATR